MSPLRVCDCDGACHPFLINATDFVQRSVKTW
jgi:hypothetical protein